MKRQQSHTLGVPGGSIIEQGSRSLPTSRSVSALDRWAARRIARATGNAPVAIRLWDGRDAYRPKTLPVGRIEIHDRRALWSILRTPELALGDAYCTGRVEIKGDLVGVLSEAYRAIDEAGPVGFKRGYAARSPRADANTRAGSRRHIEHHYDLGNDFYRLWLDERMVYTCAYYTGPETTLEAAQEAKLEHVCRKLGLRPGQKVVEAGCGWGALALHMARHHGVQVRAFNISREQIGYARARAQAEGLAGQVEFVEDDYRNVSGRYDAFVSVGMLEHVGLEHFRELGNVIDRVLVSEGMGLIHSVGRNRPMPPNAWLERRIFPGSHPPSLGQIMEVLEPHRFSVLDVENLRLHYARTLVEWLERFNRHRDQVLARYDEAFVRAWRLYLGGCAAAFRAGNLQLYQVVFSRPAHNRVPMTRAGLYGDSEAPCWDV
jgi:cyclopropane-fatty-acyl-phospholipid synthase